MAFALVVFCTVLAATEMAQKPPKPVPLEKRADFIGVLLMSAFLCLLSGMVNAMAILDMGMTVAHHTGNASHVGRLLGEGAFKFFQLMLAFWFGASVVGFCGSDGEAVFSSRLSPGLLSSGVAVLGGCLIRWLGEEDPVAVSATLIMWSFSQGILNAITRKCSSSPVSTSHHTGNLTDLGSLLGAALHALKSGDTPNLRRPFFFAVSIFAYGAGGYAMKLARPQYGAQAVLAPGFLMCVVALGVVPLMGASSQKDA